MPAFEAPSVELGSAPETASAIASPSNSEVSSTSTPDPESVRATPLFRVLSMPPPEPDQPAGQEDLERRLPGYRRIVIPREMTLIEMLRQSSNASSDEDILRIREVKLRVIAERVGLRRLNVLAPNLRQLTLDGSVLPSLRDLGIGLVHLKFLSVNRCGLTSLDGVWGLNALRELHAAGNRVPDMQPIAVLQKIHTLDLSNNRITESSRLWTLAVCTSLKKLTLRDNPLSSTPDYRTIVTEALPQLVCLDDRAINGDDDEDSDIFGAMSSSDSEAEDISDQLELPPTEPEPGPSNTRISLTPPVPTSPPPPAASPPTATVRRRPATTEGIPARPLPPRLPNRPHTAVHRPTPTQDMTNLQFMNTLLDDEWRCSGSALTSHAAVCGNLARALRRPSPHKYEYSKDERDMIAETLSDSSRALAAEIPRAPRLEDWIKFKAETGIDINILDITERPPELDATKAIERLERIEMETLKRFEKKSQGSSEYPPVLDDDLLFEIHEDQMFDHTFLLNHSYDTNSWSKFRNSSHDDNTDSDCT